MGLFSKLFQSNEKNFVSPMTGKVVAMSDIPDPAFAQKMMGDGCGIELTDGTVVAPFDAKVTAAFPTGHAFGLEAKEDGTEVLIHIGIDTVEMEGEGFSSNIKVGDEVKQGDVLVHHPYQSFDCVVNFVKNSAVDPKVLAIKQTLYRVSGNSPIIKALIDAAENGKQVTVLVELKARFDEENNINWAKKLEKAGCHVIYGLVGLKTHCKLCLVVRQEEVGIVRYVHLGTGNYNDKTAKLYTDMGMFTCRESIASDVSSLFNVLTGYSKARNWNKIAVAPTDLRSMFLQRIERETENALAGKPSKITAKVNSLVDKDIIKALYRASQAGVKIDLIVRGICCLKPNIAGISDNINVISIVGRFLEHSRIYYFQNDDSPKIYLASADWMPRNLDRRVEVAFPVDNPDLKKRIVKILDITLNDTIKARVAQNDGTYRRKDKRGKELISSQMEFYKMEKMRNDSFFAESKKDVFIPNKGE